MTTIPRPSNTVMLIHGAWVTPECFAGFKEIYEARGYRVIVPHWPFMDASLKQLRDSPDSRLNTMTIKNLVDHFESEVRVLSEPPILMGHSFGGLIVQMLVDRGLGVSGIALDPAPPRGVIPSFTAVKSAAPVLLTWRGWHRVLTMSYKTFANTFANTLPKVEMLDAYEKHIVPAPGRIYFQAALGIGNAVKFDNPKRPPLLLIVASKDRTSTPSMVRAMHRNHSKAPAETSFKEFPNRSHWLIAESGWDEVASYAIAWAEQTERSHTL